MCQLWVHNNYEENIQETLCNNWTGGKFLYKQCNYVCATKLRELALLKSIEKIFEWMALDIRKTSKIRCNLFYSTWDIVGRDRRFAVGEVRTRGHYIDLVLSATALTNQKEDARCLDQFARPCVLFDGTLKEKKNTQYFCDCFSSYEKLLNYKLSRSPW